MRRTMFIIIVTLCTGTCSTTLFAQSRHMQLLTPTTGWTIEDNHLFWTTDNGRRWSDITPGDPRTNSLASAFFLDTSSGWAVFGTPSGNDPDEGKWILAKTINSGTTWSTTPITVPELNETARVVSVNHVFFLDSTQGWMNLSLESSSNFNLGVLLSTSDGGRTWTFVVRSPHITGQVYFLDAMNGWLAGGPGSSQLYATHDGGTTWLAVSLDPPGWHGQPSRVYDIPVFRDTHHGFEVVTYSGPDEPVSKVVLFVTADGGTTWQPQVTVPQLRNRGGQGPAPSAVVSSTLVLADRIKDSIVLKQTTLGGDTTTAWAHVETPGGVLEISFVTPTRGWLLMQQGVAVAILSTIDGGNSWAQITPHSPQHLKPVRHPLILKPNVAPNAVTPVR